MTIKQVLRLGVSLACLSSPMLLWVAPPVGAQNQSDATNINATGSEIAPPFIPLPGGGTVPAFPSSAIQIFVNAVAARVNQALATNGLYPTTNLPTNIIARSGLELQLVLDVLTGTSDGASLVSLLETVPAPAGAGTAVSASGVPPSGLIEELVNSLVRLTADGKVDAGKLDRAVKAYNAAIKGATDAAYLRNPPGPLLTIRAVLSQLAAASRTPTNAQAESK